MQKKPNKNHYISRERLPGLNDVLLPKACLNEGYLKGAATLKASYFKCQPLLSYAIRCKPDQNGKNSYKVTDVCILDKKLRRKVIPTDVPRPLTNDLCVFLFQTIDAECVK